MVPHRAEVTDPDIMLGEGDQAGRTCPHAHKQHAHTHIPTIYSVAAHRISPDARQLRQLEWPSSRRRATQPWPNRLTILSQREWLR